jgi:hypothetical protein
MLIITVITLSLAALSRRNLRQALDEQLSTQALYAAESGINDVLAKLPTVSGNIANCDASKTSFSTPVSLDSSGIIRYTCVLVDKTPPQINTDITQNTVKSYPIKSANPVSELTINWKSTNTNSVNIGAPQCNAISLTCFSDSTSWSNNNNLGVLRIRLLPDNGTLSRTNLGNTIDIVAFPGTYNTNPSVFTASSTSTKKLMSGACDTKSCNVTINGLNTTLPGKYYIQLYSYYADVNVTITGKDSLNSNLSFIDAQATIDSTGAANDVLRRLRVSVPLPNVSSLPPYVLSVGDDICKRFTTNAKATTNSADANAAACNPF